MIVKKQKHHCYTKPENAEVKQKNKSNDDILKKSHALNWLEGEPWK